MRLQITIELSAQERRALEREKGGGLLKKEEARDILSRTIHHAIAQLIAFHERLDRFVGDPSDFRPAPLKSGKIKVKLRRKPTKPDAEDRMLEALVGAELLLQKIKDPIKAAYARAWINYYVGEAPYPKRGTLSLAETTKIRKGLAVLGIKRGKPK